ncbi:NEL-type E3 ubiquitin ligase domain-containing protein [Pseudomonas putida]|uniref:NEL-type E3 ubiquitin ligase domain-containing protein n=1 Tax=Pseudomonas putida TaxID=303 RepID=UPI003D03CFDE
MVAASFAPDTIDALITTRLPAWLRKASVDRFNGLRRALLRQQQASHLLQGILGQIPDLDTFAEPLLTQALGKVGLREVQPRQAQVWIEQTLVLPTAAPHLPPPRVPHCSRQSLLAAALHNYHSDETRKGLQRRGYLRAAQKGPDLPLSFERFASLCRSLDIGKRYQTVLKHHLKPMDGPGEPVGQAAGRVRARIASSVQAHFEVAIRQAALQGELDESVFLQLLPLVSSKPVVPPAAGTRTARQLYLLGKCVRGIVTVELRQKPDGPVTGIVVWIPGDPRASVGHYGSWQALSDELGMRLAVVEYRQFFGRFISERDRPQFFGVLKQRLESGSTAAKVELDGRNLPIETGLFDHLANQFVEKLLDDARVLAVPTDDEDEPARRRRLDAYVELSLDVVSLAALFVPVLGEVLLAVGAVQIAGEVYEGYQDWQIGDRQGALDHLFNVAGNVVAGLAIGAGSSVAMGALARVPFVDDLVPIRNASGQVKLCAKDLPGYRLGEADLVSLAPASDPSYWQLHQGDAIFKAETDPATGASRLRHPQRSGAYAPALEENAAGGWRHALEQPQEWQGARKLMRRLGLALSELDDTTAEYLMLTTGFDEARLRRLHLENANVPARLLDALEWYRLHEQFTTLPRNGLEMQISARQAQPGSLEALLLRDFSGLSVRTARELVSQASGDEMDAMVARRRVPLTLAERARWVARDSRLDRALAGVRLPRLMNADGERLVLGLLPETGSWPSEVSIELRDGAADGALLGRLGAEAAQSLRHIIRGSEGYQLAGSSTSPSGLLQVVVQCRPEVDVALTSEQLASRLLALAAADRERAAQLVGIAPIGGGFRPPRRLGDGRLGYTLSGRGESSRQAIRRGIHQIFPLMSNGELDAYLMALLERREDLWAHYARLQEQLTGIRTSLRAWQRTASNPLDAIRRRRVANQLRRSWRRKLVNEGGEYVLVIEGERVGQMPSLPDGVDYSHVRRLVLRGMNLADLDESFLGRFTRLYELDLRDNHLTAIPPGIELMSQLRQLHLSSNRIVMDVSGERRLSALRHLQVLDLSHNPLGRAPILPRLRNLRDVRLRSVGLQVSPSRSYWRAYIDARDNRIRELRQGLRQLGDRLGRMALHDNPLDQASAALVEGQGGVHPGARRSPAYQHEAVTETVRDRWLGSVHVSLRAERERRWEALRAEPGSDGLFRFLADFSRSEDFDAHPGHYRNRVWRILEFCELHEHVRTRLFHEASGPRTCEDRLLYTLGQLELGVLVERATGEGGRAIAESRLVRLARSLFRLDEVDRLAARHLQRMRTQASRLVDDIEVRMFYRAKLQRPLGLPIEPVSMHYEAFAHVDMADVLAAQEQVIAAETAEALIDSLAQRPFWETHVREYHAARFEQATERFQSQLEANESERERGALGEWEFLQRSNALMHEYEEAERALIRTLAREAYERLEP